MHSKLLYNIIIVSNNLLNITRERRDSMYKQLVLSRVESEVVINLLELDINYYQAELDVFKSKEELLQQHTHYYNAEDEDIVFLSNQVIDLKVILVDIYKFRSYKEQVLVNSETVQQLICTLDRRFDENNDYKLEDSTYKEYLTNQNSLLMNIFKKLYELELTDYNKELILNKSNN